MSYYTITVPSGKLGLTLANRKDIRGTVASEVSISSVVANLVIILLPLMVRL
jgi:hypothetical protein